MKTAIITCFVSFFTFGQINEDDLLLIKATTDIAKNHPYTYNPESLYLGKRHQDYIKRKNFYKKFYVDGASGRDSVFTFSITDSEVNEILRQIESNKNFKFPESIFPNSVCVPKDSTIQYIEKKHIEWRKGYVDAFETGDTLKVKEYMEKNPPHYMAGSAERVNYFSKPIYLRNNKIALMLSGYFCGNDCGCDGLTFYRKNDDGEWTEIISIAAGCY